MTRTRSIPAALFLLAVLSACAEPARITGKPSGYADLECVSYARQLTGVQIQGDAWTWWHSAAGRYARSNKPTPMSVLVLRRTHQLPGGHVAVVRSVVGAREIRVDHANWDDRRTRGRIYENMSVIDVSPRNDWTSLRFWNGAGYGKVYAAHGFIHNRSVAQADDPNSS
jgi:surface antigen